MKFIVLFALMSSSMASQFKIPEFTVRHDKVENIKDVLKGLKNRTEERQKDDA